jgi:hypothetical protein
MLACLFLPRRHEDTKDHKSHKNDECQQSEFSNKAYTKKLRATSRLDVILAKKYHAFSSIYKSKVYVLHDGDTTEKR